MRFMLFIYPGGPVDDENYGPTEETVAAMAKFNEELTQAGVLLSLDGLHPMSEGARVTATGDGTAVTDGPFAETKELVGGYWLIKADSKEDAVAWAQKIPLGEGDFVDVRRVYEMSDFSQEIQDAAQLSETPPGQTTA
jgi:hypothetical protein